MSGSRNSFLDIILLAAVFFFLYLAANAWKTDSQRVADGVASMAWPSAKARIVTCDMTKKRVRTRNSSYYIYKPEVTYEFQVREKRFIGTRITFAGTADHFSREKKAPDFICDYLARGTTHSVRYNPVHPGDSVLMPGIDADTAEFDSWKWLCASICSGIFWCAFVLARSGNGYEPSQAKFMVLLIPAALLVLIVMCLQPTAIRLMVPPSAVVQQFR